MMLVVMLVVYLRREACNCVEDRAQASCSHSCPIGQYQGFCARSCFYCGPTPTPTLIPPTPAPSTVVPSISQVPTAVCNDGFLQRDAKDFLRDKLGWPELCRTTQSSTTCCQDLQESGRCETTLGLEGSLFGYCAKTCGYCGFDGYEFQSDYSGPSRLESPIRALSSHLPCTILSRRTSINSKDMMSKILVLAVCGARPETDFWVPPTKLFQVCLPWA